MLAAFPAGFRPMVAQPPMLWAQPLPISVRVVHNLKFSAWVAPLALLQYYNLSWHSHNTISSSLAKSEPELITISA